MPKVALIITTYNRPELLQQCLDSLSRCDLSQVNEVVFYDDKSTDTSVIKELYPFAMSLNCGVRIFINPANVGIKQTLSWAYQYAFQNNDLCINLDPNAIVKPNFITELLRLKSEHPKHIISGFNCNHKQNPVISEHDGYVLRKHCNGINMLIDKQQYEEIIKPALSGSGNWDYSATHKLPFVISRPSLVQHLGANQSSMGHVNGDVACDFKLLTLPDVSLFGIDAHDPEGIRRAADICTRDVEFAGVKIITERLFSGREAYSKFMIQDLWQHTKDLPGTHILTIHPDGYIQNPNAWNDEWLNVDYLGATWLYKDGMNVGNGGFSLRSKRFIEACSQLDIQDFHPEDCKLSRKYRPQLEALGMVYGTEEQANRFSIEAYGCVVMNDSEGVNASKYSGQFGAHGFHVSGLPNPYKRPKPVIPAPVPRTTMKQRTMGIPRKRF